MSWIPLWTNSDPWFLKLACLSWTFAYVSQAKNKLRNLVYIMNSSPKEQRHLILIACLSEWTLARVSVSPKLMTSGWCEWRQCWVLWVVGVILCSERVHSTHTPWNTKAENSVMGRGLDLPLTRNLGGILRFICGRGQKECDGERDLTCHSLVTSVEF